jgi:MFS transporter, PAT family, beta-lactamase induction signal transducer AmpG
MSARAPDTSPADAPPRTSTWQHAIGDRRVGVMLWLGFASGLPLALTSGTLQAWMTVDGVSLTTIGFATLIGQAYVFKFLWAPLLDRFAPPGFGRGLGRRRGWLVATQAAIIAGLGLMALLSPSHSLMWLALVAVAVAFFSASQDVVSDAYRADVLLPAQRGAGAAVSVLGYRLGMVVSGGLALWLAERVTGWAGMYVVMAALMLVGVLATFYAPEPDAPPSTPRSLQAAVIEPLREFFGRPGAWALLGLIVCYKLGDAFAGALSTTFLIRGAGFGADEVGLVNKTFGLVATIVGALAGGVLMARLGLFRSLLWFGIGQALTNLGYWLIAVSPKSLALMASAIGVENLVGGMGTAAFVALLMSLVDPRFSATQMALLSALAAVGRVYVGPATGYLVQAVGWPHFFLLTVLFSTPGLLLLILMRRRIEARD